MENIKKFFDGKKSHAAGLGLIVMGGLVLTGTVEIDQKQLEAAISLVAGFAAIALRLAVAKIGAKTDA